MASTFFDEKNLVCDERTCIPKSVISPIHVLLKILRIVYPIAIPLMDDRTSVVQEVRRDLQCWTMILAKNFVEDVSKRLDIVFGIKRAICERPPSLLVFEQTLHQLLVRHNLVILR